MTEVLDININTQENINVYLPEEVSCGTIEAYFGESAELTLDVSLKYIKSGQQAIQDYVNTQINPTFDKYIDEAKEAASNADADADNAKESATIAYQSEQNAIAQSTKATQEANSAAESAYNAQTSALAAHEYASNAEADAQNANEALDHVLASEEKARVWADGNDTEVEPLGGTHSAMVSAGLAYAYAVAPEDVPVEEWASKHNLFVQGERGERGEKGEATYANKGVILLRADGWDNTTKTQSVLLQGVKMDSILWVTPAFGYYDVYVNSAIRGVSQSVNTITFACNKIPSVDIKVGVIIA